MNDPGASILTTVQQGNTIRIYAVVFGVLISIIHLRNHLGGDPRPKFVLVMQGFNSDLKTANISKHMYRLVSSTVQWHDVEVQIYDLVLTERRLERAVQGETADQAAARRRQARETRRVRIDFVKRCIGRDQEILGEGMQAIDNENTTNASLNKSAAQKQFLLAEMTRIINRLKTLPASAEGDVTEMRPREKYFLLPEEAQNAIWDEKWPASKVMFYCRHDFRLTCKNIWNRVVAIDIQNHYRKQHSDAQIVAMKPLAVNNRAYRDALNAFHNRYNADCMLNPDCGHFGAQFKVENLSVVHVVETSRDESGGLAKNEEQHIHDAATMTRRSIRELDDPEWLRD